MLFRSENKLLMEKKVYFRQVKGNSLYLEYSGGERITVRAIYDLLTGEETIESNIEGLTSINTKYALRYDSEKEQKYIYDINAQKDLPLEMEDVYICPISFTSDRHMVISIRKYKLVIRWEEGEKKEEEEFVSCAYYYVPVEALADGLQESDCTEIYTIYASTGNANGI